MRGLFVGRGGSLLSLRNAAAKEPVGKTDFLAGYTSFTWI